MIFPEEVFSSGQRRLLKMALLALFVAANALYFSEINDGAAGPSALDQLHGGHVVPNWQRNWDAATLGHLPLYATPAHPHVDPNSGIANTVAYSGRGHLVFVLLPCAALFALAYALCWLGARNAAR